MTCPRCTGPVGPSIVGSTLCRDNRYWHFACYRNDHAETHYGGRK